MDLPKKTVNNEHIRKTHCKRSSVLDDASDSSTNSEKTFDSSSTNSLPSLEINMNGVKDKWQHLITKFLEPNIKHTKGFKHFGYHLSIYLYFGNLSDTLLRQNVSHLTSLIKMGLQLKHSESFVSKILTLRRNITWT